MESIVVIKVKYGETLRRFNGRVVNERLDLGLDGLRKKIFDFFSFAPDAEFVLTYIDEDGDVVTLVNDEDLDDAMRQSLNPLRITVHLNADKNGRHCARSSGSSNPMRSPRIQQKMSSLNANVSEILKSVPDPFREAFSMFSADVVAKASSSPVIAEPVDCVSKMGLSYLNPVAELQAGVESSQQGGFCGEILNPSVTEELRASKLDGSNPDVQQKAAVESLTSLGKQVLPHPISPEFMRKNKTADLKNPDKSVEASAKMQVSVIEAPVRPLPVSTASDVVVPLRPSPVSKKVSVCQGGENSECGFQSANSGAFGAGIGMKSSCFGSSLGPELGTSPLGECPFSGMPIANDLPMLPPQCVPRMGPFKRSCNKNAGVGTIFHRGVRCDGCGVHPITGPRFKSKVKEDYDMCHICFGQMGNDTDYIRVDRPATYRHPFGLHGLYGHPRVHYPKVPQVMKGMKQSLPKPDSRFVQDVNVPDGTIMAPSTEFTKIWRMRNNGTTLWPRGTRLVWIGGDRLSNAQAVELEVHSNGLPVDGELDIAVDFTSPKISGRYISYWRMALPSGQKFGQLVWVLIQVDASMRDFVSGSFKGLNLNFPPSTNDILGPEIINVNNEPVVVEDSSSQPDNSSRATNLVGSVFEEPPSKEPNYPINDPLIVGDVILSPTRGDTPASVSYPIIDFSESSPTVHSTLHPTTNAQTSTQQGAGNNEVEQTLLRELEDMGFNQVDLNREILRMNKYDLEQSVDDLCGVSNRNTDFVHLQEDLMLKELEKMGFFDNLTNKRLLRKNNWSLKRVVMDLISGKKP